MVKLQERRDEFVSVLQGLLFNIERSVGAT